MAREVGKQCETCKHWKQCDQYPRWGDCVWADETYPEWLVETDMFPSNRKYRDEGKECMTWQPK